MPVCIAGMHRSGTSMVARLLQQCGLYLGQDTKLISGDAANPDGYWEHLHAVEINDALLAHLGGAWDVVPARPDGWELQPELLPLRFRAAQFVNQFADHSFWGWKDPRNSLTLPFWKRLMPDLKVVMCIRNPLDVVHSLRRRGYSSEYFSLGLWLAYNQALLTCVPPNDRIVTHYESYFHDPTAELRRVLRLLNAPLAEEAIQRASQFASLSVRRHQSTLADLLAANLPEEILTIYTTLCLEAGPIYQLALSHQPTPEPESSAPSHPNHANYTDALRQLQVEALTAKLAEHQQSILKLTGQINQSELVVQQLKAQVTDRQRAIENLTARVVEQEQIISGQTQQIADTERALAELVTQTTQYQQALNAQIMERDQRLAQKDGRIYDLSLQAQRSEERLEKLENSRIWRLALRWYAWRNALWPRRSLPIAPPQAAQTGARVVEAKAPLQAEQPWATPSTPRKILFISHDAHRHGAQLLLLSFLKWFKANTSTPFEILLRRDGELRAEFEQLAPVTIWMAGSDQAQTRQQMVERFRRANIGLLYVNTIVNGDILESLSALNCPVICHVHELDYWMTHQTRPDNNAQVRRWTTHYIAVSRAVQQALIQTLQIPESHIDLVYEFIPALSEIDRSPQKLHHVRQQLQLPPEAIIVGGSGTTDWRKGPDIFIQLARAIHQRQPERPIHFVWVGGESQGQTFGALWHDVQRIGLESYIHFIGARPNPLDYFAIFDVFALVSREDPFPLVALEAAGLGKPIVCFNGAGGAPELVETDSGFVVPYLDVEAMADKIIILANTPDVRERLGQRAAQKVGERHTLKLTAPKLAQIIERVLT